MKGQWLVYLAVLVFVTSVGCGLFPRPTQDDPTAEAITPVMASTSTSPTAGMPYVGIAMQLQDPNRIDEYVHALDDIAHEGADTVSLVVAAHQENGLSVSISIDPRQTPSAEQLSKIILHAKAIKLRVFLMPIVLLDNPRDGEWRGKIAPAAWDQWWKSYRQMIGTYAAIAQKTGVDVFSVGSELVSTERFADEWAKTIQMVRQIYSGRLTYSSNWDHYTSIPFWSQLDLIGMNSYYVLGDDRNVTVEEINRRWAAIQTDLFRFQQKIGKPLVLLEAGWCSIDNAANEPWWYCKDGVSEDSDLQKKLYQGFFDSWWGKPECGGFMLWEWTLDPNPKGYSPHDKPAEAVMRQWFAKPRWQVVP